MSKARRANRVARKSGTWRGNDFESRSRGDEAQIKWRLLTSSPTIKNRAMKNFRILAVLLLASLGLASSQNFAAAKTFNVLDFGAKGDGATLDTVAIQRAIDAAAGDGGAVFISRKHTFLIATLDLKGGINFRLDGTLLISTNQSDYASDGVITASNAPNLKITGAGKISGRSLSFMTGYDAANEWWLFKEWRPQMFVLTGCTNLVVRDLTFCDVPNCDGIDPDHCRNMEIHGCHLTCGDDAIVIKATRQTNDFGACANIHVHDCVIRTQDAGLKIGTETTSDIHDVLFERCKILSSSRGLCIQLRDEGNVSNITFRDIEFVSRYHRDPKST